MAGEATASFRGRLTELQRSVLAAFFARERIGQLGPMVVPVGTFKMRSLAIHGYHA